MGSLKCLSRESVTVMLVIHLPSVLLRLSADTIRQNLPFSRHIYLVNMKARDSIIFLKSKAEILSKLVIFPILLQNAIRNHQQQILSITICFAQSA